MDILEDFENIASPIRKRVETIAYENLELTKLRDWLLPMLMNGQVVVD
jgi:type I restriction enzyme S subunit